MATPQSTAGVNGPRNPVSQPQAPDQHRGVDATNAERPLNVKPAPEGGVAIGGQEGLSEGHASAADKIIGKAEKVTGKYMHKPDMHERGELRESGGKAAEIGESRAPHD